MWVYRSMTVMARALAAGAWVWAVFMLFGTAAAASSGPLAVPLARADSVPPGGLRLEVPLLLRLAQAESAAPADQPEGALDKAKQFAGKAVDTAKEIGKSYEQLLLGQSVTVGIARVFPEAVLHEPSNPGVTTEDYTGPGLYTPAITFNSASASGDKYVGGRIGRLHILWTLNFQANYAQFNADSQTQQTLVGGQTPNGYVRGDFLYGVALLAHNYTYEGESVNWGARVAIGLGAGIAQFNGKLDYSAGGQNYSQTFSHGYDQLLLAEVALIEVRIERISFSAQRVVLDGADVHTSGSDTHYGVEVDLWTYQAGYVFYF